MEAISSAKPSGDELRVEHLIKTFKGRTVLNDVNLTIKTGEIVALVGASGSGKTVLLDHLVGLHVPTSGRILAADHSRGGELVDLAVVSADQLDQIRLHWALVFQHNALFTGTVFDNVALWLREHTRMSEREIFRRVRESIAAASLDVDDVLRKERDALSGGMAKRVAIARAIAVDPAVIFYDEPTTGLDPVVGGQIHDLIWNVHHRPRADGRPRTSILVTHDKDLLRRIGPRVVMLHEAQVCFDGPYELFGHAECPPARQYLRAMPVLHARHEGSGKRE